MREEQSFRGLASGDRAVRSSALDPWSTALRTMCMAVRQANQNSLGRDRILPIRFQGDILAAVLGDVATTRGKRRKTVATGTMRILSTDFEAHQELAIEKRCVRHFCANGIARVALMRIQVSARCNMDLPMMSLSRRGS